MMENVATSNTPAISGYYRAIKALVQRLDDQGHVEWRPGGAGGGGSWEVLLHGRTKLFRFDNGCDFDDLYAAYATSGWAAANTATSETPLKPDAFWLLVNLMQ